MIIIIILRKRIRIMCNIKNIVMIVVVLIMMIPMAPEITLIIRDCSITALTPTPIALVETTVVYLINPDQYAQVY